MDFIEELRNKNYLRHALYQSFLKGDYSVQKTTHIHLYHTHLCVAPI